MSFNEVMLLSTNVVSCVDSHTCGSKYSMSISVKNAFV